MVYTKFLVALLLAGTMSLAYAADPGTMIRSDGLRSQPTLSASYRLTVPAGASVTVIKKQGGWYQVGYKGQYGWVRLLYLRTFSSSTSTDISVLNKGRTGSVTATAGLRGLSEEDLKKSTPNWAEVGEMESNYVPANVARTFALKRGLMQKSVAYLPAPVSSEQNKVNAEPGSGHSVLEGF